MSPQNVREKWLSRRQQLEAHAEAFHDSQSVAFGLLDAYDHLSKVEKAEVHPILAEWFVSSDNKLRYDAAFLVIERQIRELAPAVALAIDRLKDIPGPEARDEVEDLRRLWEQLKR